MGGSDAKRPRPVDGAAARPAGFSTESWHPVEPAPAPVPERVDSIAGGQGMRRLSPGAAPSRADGVQGVSRRLVALLAVLAVLVFAVVFLVARNALQSIGEASVAGVGASAATDEYVCLAVGDSALGSAYLVYADSINERAVACRLPADLDAGREASGRATLADVYAADGAEAVAEAVASLSGVEIGAYAQLDGEEADGLFAILDRDPQAPSPNELAARVCSRPQGVDETALRGLLRTLRDVGPDGAVVFDAPTRAMDRQDGSTGLVLEQEVWLTEVRGMRDPSAGAL